MKTSFVPVPGLQHDDVRHEKPKPHRSEPVTSPVWNQLRTKWGDDQKGDERRGVLDPEPDPVAANQIAPSRCTVQVGKPAQFETVAAQAYAVAHMLRLAGRHIHQRIARPIKSAGTKKPSHWLLSVNRAQKKASATTVPYACTGTPATTPATKPASRNGTPAESPLAASQRITSRIRVRLNPNRSTAAARGRPAPG